MLHQIRIQYAVKQGCVRLRDAFTCHARCCFALVLVAFKFATPLALVLPSRHTTLVICIW